MKRYGDFTPAERKEALHALLKIYRNENFTPLRPYFHRVAVCLRKMRSGQSLRDEFGLNRVLVVLESMLLAADGIGLRGIAMPAFAICYLFEKEESIEVLEGLPEGMTGAVEAFRKPLSLRASMEVMRTDNFRNLFVSQAGDMRVVLLLIAWCVIMMRKIKDTPNEQAQKRLSLEAAYLYAPLAHKLGLYKLKSELEDLSLKYLEHDAYYSIKDSLNATKESRDAYIERFITPIRKMLDDEGLLYHMKGRTKSIHSIWQKMKKQQCGFDGVYDLFAIRIILDAPLEKEKEQCWKVFSLITDQYESNLKRLRDWLTVPKSNGYESLHITVRGPEDKWVEVQIRTERMDEIAEHGLAAHWRYKGVKSSGGGVDAWLADIRNALENGDDGLLTESLTTKVGKSEVYVFTPKGDLLRLPSGSTVLDFAYYVHSGVGNRCIGAKVNGRNVSIRQQLDSGDTVEIITSNQQTPKMEWTNIVVSSHAKSKIRSAVRDLQVRQGAFARELLERKLKNRKIEWDESIISQLVKKLGFKDSVDFYKAIVEEKVDVNTLLETYQDLARREAGLAERAAVRSAGEFSLEREQEKQNIASGEDVLVIDRNLKGLDFQMARCCNPVYGDDVFGFVMVGGGIKIHRTTCPNAPALRDRFAYRIVPARWAGKGGGKYPITLHVVGQDDLGIVNNITSIISKEEHIMLRSINIDSNDGLFSGILTVMVHDTQVLAALIKKIRNVKGVKAVTRA